MIPGACNKQTALPGSGTSPPFRHPERSELAGAVAGSARTPDIPLLRLRPAEASGTRGVDVPGDEVPWPDDWASLPGAELGQVGVVGDDDVGVDC